MNSCTSLWLRDMKLNTIDLSVDCACSLQHLKTAAIEMLSIVVTNGWYLTLWPNYMHAKKLAVLPCVTFFINVIILLQITTGFVDSMSIPILLLILCDTITALSVSLALIFQSVLN